MQTLGEARFLRDAGISRSRLVTGASGNFRHLHQEVKAGIEDEPIGVNPRDPSTVGTGASPIGKGEREGRIQPRTACTHFLGTHRSSVNHSRNLTLFRSGQCLSQLYRHPQPPDPTAPKEPVCIDPENQHRRTPRHPEVFAAPPPSFL